MVNRVSRTGSSTARSAPSLQATEECQPATQSRTRTRAATRQTATRTAQSSARALALAGATARSPRHTREAPREAPVVQPIATKAQPSASAPKAPVIQPAGKAQEEKAQEEVKSSAVVAVQPEVKAPVVPPVVQPPAQQPVPKASVAVPAVSSDQQELDRRIARAQLIMKISAIGAVFSLAMASYLSADVRCVGANIVGRMFSFIVPACVAGPNPTDIHCYESGLEVSSWTLAVLYTKYCGDSLNSSN